MFGLFVLVLVGAFIEVLLGVMAEGAPASYLSPAFLNVNAITGAVAGACDGTTPFTEFEKLCNGVGGITTFEELMEETD